MTIKLARQSAGLTQQQLADRIGCHKTQIQKIEAGQIHLGNLTARTYLRLCRAIGLDPYDTLQED